jgi:hypothetical protein
VIEILRLRGNSPKFDGWCWMKSHDGEMIPDGDVKERKERKGLERSSSKKRRRGRGGAGG